MIVKRKGGRKAWDNNGQKKSNLILNANNELSVKEQNTHHNGPRSSMWIEVKNKKGDKEIILFRIRRKYPIMLVNSSRLLSVTWK